MSQSSENYFITTPIYYVNSDPHIGHAYTNIIAGCATEWRKLQGHKTFLLTGTDEHGQKIETSAKSLDIPIKNFVDTYSARFHNLANTLDIEYNDFIRTTDYRHMNAVQALWKILEENGYIYLGFYEGWYSIRDEAFYNEAELINGLAPSGAPVEWHKEESYFFRLSSLQDKLLDFYLNNPSFIIPEARFNEVISFVKSGLQDLSISRTSFQWGIPVPGNDKHIIYVWMDALANYIAALDFPDIESQKYLDFWVNSDSTHIIGKDILRFHAVYWPAFLIAADLPLPKRLVVHGWWMKDGHKISKSLGNVIDPFELIEKFGLEYVKYFFLTESGINNDGNYVEQRFIEKINGDLVNNFGNLLSRVTNMVVQYFEGVVKYPENELKEYVEQKRVFLENYSNLMNDYKYHMAAAEIFNFSKQLNQFIDEEKPWILFKEGKLDRLNGVLYKTLDGLRVITISLKPFIKNKSNEILSLMEITGGFGKLGAILAQPTKYTIKEKINIFNRIV